MITTITQFRKILENNNNISITDILDTFWDFYQEQNSYDIDITENIFKTAALSKGNEWLINWMNSYQGEDHLDDSEKIYWDMYYNFCEENNFKID